MHHPFEISNTQGMSLVEVVVAIGVFVLVFGGLLTSVEYILKIVGSAKEQAGAVALADDRMEYIRSLAYDSVGTQGGIPDGSIPQNRTVNLNGVTYSERVLIEYIDDPKDGLDTLDSNGIVADYKLVKVEYSWNDKGQSKVISLISNIIPSGIETTAGGGTLRVNVFDGKILPVSGASVHVYNNTGTTTIDTTRLTNTDGVALFSGAPALANYQITVTKALYSTDQTYVASSTNPNPSTPPVAVLVSQVSTMNFQIDTLSNLSVKTFGLPTLGSFEDLFDDQTEIATTTAVTIASGGATLSGAPGSYSASGTLASVAIAPGTLDSWDTALVDAVVPVNTALLVHIYAVSGTSTRNLIPDTDLPGNAVGFAPGTIDLSSLNVASYPALSLEGILTTSDTATSSTINSWNINYTLSQAALPSIPFTFVSDKTIGTTAGFKPVYKYSHSFTTDGSGALALPNLEWGLYNVTVTSGAYTVAEACSDIPYILNAGVSDTLTLTLAPSTAFSLRVHVVDINGADIPNANIQLSRSGFSDSKVTSLCGQTFFNSGLSANADYGLDVHAFGYTSQSLSSVVIDGKNTLTVTLIAS